jgi:hypothetical protein
MPASILAGSSVAAVPVSASSSAMSASAMIVAVHHCPGLADERYLPSLISPDGRQIECRSEGCDAARSLLDLRSSSLTMAGMRGR